MPGKGDAINEKYINMGKFCISFNFLIGQEVWKEKYEYGRRWCIESYFSAVKRSFGEGTTAKRFDMVKKEFMINLLLNGQLQQLT